METILIMGTISFRFMKGLESKKESQVIKLGKRVTKKLVYHDESFLSTTVDQDTIDNSLNIISYKIQEYEKLFNKFDEYNDHNLIKKSTEESTEEEISKDIFANI
jgi:hypothetical protein